MITHQRLSSLVKATAVISLGVAAASAQAATWNKTTTGGSCSSFSATPSCTINAATDANGAGTTATVTGWSNAATGTSTSTTGTWRAANLTDQGASGIGVNHGNTTADPNEGSGTAPGYEHAVDNNGRTDAVRLQFLDSTILRSVTLGWIGSDYDFTVLRWVGNGTLPTGATAGTMNWRVNASTNVASDSDTTAAGWNGWQLVGNYAGTVTGPTGTDQTVSINAAGDSSSFWLIMAYNSAFGTGAGLEMGNDSFKFLSFTSKVPASSNVPEPAGLALAGLALFGAGWVRRRKA
ncbi:hypothetical protein HNQ51_003507 [Inhella inkyongensis]|uniref:Ice-binding protein C-terminal domain-containing protein n=1 Tax=Inhella inkyongensis TaxID=392593 RepID=A0A840SBK8_9BURK|nr:exosortase-dependent surface protein XDP1 [Inhella inkyongensis]MBB5206164.1 hypothetical protein [Inhella inkyongensis]